MAFTSRSLRGRTIAGEFYPQLLMVGLDLPAALLMEEKFAPISERAKREPL
jgi:hypothetical protein